MTTQVQTTQVAPNVVVSTLTADDGSTGYVMCSVPGGRPLYCLGDPTQAGSTVTSIVGAPTCDMRADVHAFVVERFSD